ncbi:UDP-perosamine 4-acetyltransferase [Paenibacillus sp. 1_12]|uniref:acetyltransferase n=1 Tax=Paenibacillus sp. 1_12 TaxID=1566278 RepID=UPI0008F0CD73|nr:acetyltransferase [Paenibacillus sp. 1_12]SFK72111.1 UDP-perosamine 4-acetyltransferase [Paenibacillus sp. 1_12]
MVSPNKVVIIGGGGHAKVIIDILKSDPEVEIIGCTDTHAKGTVSGIRILGDDTILQDLYLSGIRHAVIAIGDNAERKRLASKAACIGFRYVNAISRFAYVSASVQLGVGIAIMPGSVIQPDAQIGDLAIINTNASIDHDCKIGALCHVAPGVTLSGRVVTGEGVFLGTGAKVIDGMHIGEWSIVGAGAVVVNALPDHCLAIGVPARIMRK